MAFAYLYVDMNSYFASVAQQEEPFLRGKPLGIVTIAKGNAALIAASYEAKKLGIGMGVRMYEARRICPHMAFRPARHDVYVAYHHQIKAAVARIYPVAGVHSIDEFSCLLLGGDQTLDRARALAEAIRQSIYEHVGEALRCSIGVGPSLLLAKLAGELHKPCGFDWLDQTVLPQKIAHLQLKDIAGIGRNMARRLQAAGVHNVTQLYALAPKHARKIWHSVTGERFILALQGHDVPTVGYDEKGTPFSGKQSLGHGQILSPQNCTPENARLVARRLLIKAATRLRRAGLYASGVHIYVKCAQKGRCTRRQTCAHTQDSFVLLHLFAHMWDQLAPIKPINVSVLVFGLAHAHECTRDLFALETQMGTPTAREKLCALVDQMNQRHGQDTIFYGERPKTIAPYTGAKIAFGRIPTREEFRD